MDIRDIPMKHGRYINARGQVCVIVDVFGERCDTIAYVIDGEVMPCKMWCMDFIKAWRAV